MQGLSNSFTHPHPNLDSEDLSLKYGNSRKWLPSRNSFFTSALQQVENDLLKTASLIDKIEKIIDYDAKTFSNHLTVHLQDALRIQKDQLTAYQSTWVKWGEAIVDPRIFRIVGRIFPSIILTKDTIEKEIQNCSSNILFLEKKVKENSSSASKKITVKIKTHLNILNRFISYLFALKHYIGCESHFLDLFAQVNDQVGYLNLPMIDLKEFIPGDINEEYRALMLNKPPKNEKLNSILKNINSPLSRGEAQYGAKFIFFNTPSNPYLVFAPSALRPLQEYCKPDASFLTELNNYISSYGGPIVYYIIDPTNSPFREKAPIELKDLDQESLNANHQKVQQDIADLIHSTNLQQNGLQNPAHDVINCLLSKCQEIDFRNINNDIDNVSEEISNKILALEEILISNLAYLQITPDETNLQATLDKYHQVRSNRIFKLLVKVNKIGNFVFKVFKHLAIFFGVAAGIAFILANPAHLVTAGISLGCAVTAGLSKLANKTSDLILKKYLKKCYDIRDKNEIEALKDENKIYILINTLTSMHLIGEIRKILNENIEEES